MTQPPLTLHRFTLGYRQTTIIHSLNANVVTGMPTVVFGVRGAGKTTLLRTLAGLTFQSDIAWSGSALLAGRPISPDHHLTLVAPLATDWLGTLGDALSRDGVDARAARLGLLRALGLFRLTHGLDRPLISLSTLDARLALLARFASPAIPGGPVVLALDEPTVGLPPAEIEEFCGVLRALAATTTLLVATACEVTAGRLGPPISLRRTASEDAEEPFAHGADARPPGTAAGGEETASTDADARPPGTAAGGEATASTGADAELRAQDRESGAILVGGAASTASETGVDGAPEAFSTCDSYAPPSLPASQRKTPTLPYLAVPADLPAWSDVDVEDAPSSTVTAKNVAIPIIQPRWVADLPLASCRRPGLFGTLGEDLDALRSAGVDVLVSLEAEWELPAAAVEASGILYIHAPVADGGVPTADRLRELCERIDAHIVAGRRVCVQCKGGVGRTGTVLASYLMWRGEERERAVETIRRFERRFVSTAAQERFLAEVDGSPPFVARRSG